MPIISVIMPVYNGETYLALAIQSILSQTVKDFELIIINDGSSDSTSKIIESFNDKRIVCIENDSNLGLSKSLNIGIVASRGKYIARMDSDDICFPYRFRIQMDYLEKHENLGVVGSPVILIDKAGVQKSVFKRHSTSTLIKWSSLFSTPLVHPSVMGRTEVFKNNLYDESLLNSEDYELWSRLIFKRNISVGNTSEPLMQYRVFSQSFTQSLDPQKRTVSAKNSIRNIEIYTKLTDLEKETIIKLRQGLTLSVRQLFLVLTLYLRAARLFIEKEFVSEKDLFSIYSHILLFAISLVKHQIKNACKLILSD